MQLLKKLFQLAKDTGFRIVTAESLTAGLISSCIAEETGASDVLLAGFVVYTPEAKAALLGLSPLLIKRYTVVSEEVAKAMASGALMKANAFTKSEKLISIAVTGIAGPGTGGEEKPVGTVCFGLSSYIREKVIYSESETVRFTGTRNEVRKKTAEKAIKKLIKMLENKKI